MSRHRTRVPAALATIARDVGSLLLIEALLMTVTVAVALAFREFHAALGFLLAGGVTAAVGGGARLRFADAPNPRMKHGMVIAAAGWFAVALFGALGFFLTAHLTPESVAAGYVPAGAEYSESSLRYFEHPLHALFESMSGWTGSGLTMAVHEPSLPYALQWWRSLIQWVGGVGVIVLTVSILSRPGSGSYALYRSETREEKIHPSVVSTVRTVWKIFVAYSVLSVLALFAAIHWTQDLPLFATAWQALNHAMTGLATGGFSVTDNSIATYDSPLIETVLLPIMTLGAIAFPIHYGVLNGRDPRLLVSDLQARWLFVLLGVGVVVLSAQNALVDPVAASAFDGSSDAVRDSTFQWISALSCTGFQSAPIGEWSPGGKLVVSVAMVIGGAAGSTVGGIKIIRAYTVARGIGWQFGRVFLPANAVVTATIGDRKLGRSAMVREFNEAAIVSLLWLIMLAVSSLILVNAVGANYSYADALFEVASAQGNVGLSTGITGPAMPTATEVMFLFNMWIGRLEIIPVLVLFRALFKRGGVYA
jgi:trk system potassium uptake protein TrkH